MSVQAQQDIMRMFGEANYLAIIEVPGIEERNAATRQFAPSGSKHVNQHGGGLEGDHSLLGQRDRLTRGRLAVALYLC